VLGTNGQFCPSAAMYYEGFQRSICDNRFLKSTFDARYPSNDTVTMTLTVPQGCNLACGCCGPGGNRCHKVHNAFVSWAGVRGRGERALCHQPSPHPPSLIHLRRARGGRDCVVTALCGAFLNRWFVLPAAPRGLRRRCG
jgi:hypothetical protein